MFPHLSPNAVVFVIHTNTGVLRGQKMMVVLQIRGYGVHQKNNNGNWILFFLCSMVVFEQGQIYLLLLSLSARAC